MVFGLTVVSANHWVYTSNDSWTCGTPCVLPWVARSRVHMPHARSKANLVPCVPAMNVYEVDLSVSCMVAVTATMATSINGHGEALLKLIKSGVALDQYVPRAVLLLRTAVVRPCFHSSVLGAPQCWVLGAGAGLGAGCLLAVVKE